MKWKRPSGSEIETNDAESTIEGCKAMGWEPMDGAPIVEPVTQDWGSSEPGEEKVEGDVQLGEGDGTLKKGCDPEVPELSRKRKRGK